ncbi:capsular exopolysaccharide family [Thiothrix nivea DSM 5205]|uniref:non-specific protein-tyrosine kinase n=2 Tax=Thiothrix nivea TaxID=1031 RepID=A0A656HBY6_THINJ|nr:polysaccharide biosynthesis tyrosine autokinase [Thiothrix nivea]EIJ34378.1 capsular exopolysaccharide family [Thiothrix nivea DSM 5205]
MENYYISQSKNLDVRSNNAQIVEYIPIEEVAPKLSPDEPGLGELWRRLMRRKWLLLGIALTTFAIAVLITLTSKNVYRASTTLQVTAEDVRSLDLGSANDTARVPLDEKAFYLTQTELLHSQRLSRDVIEQLNIAEKFSDNDSLSSKMHVWLSTLKQKLTNGGEISQPNTMEENFQRFLSISPVESSQIFRISYDHQDPELAANIVNTLADSYKEMNFELRNERVARAKNTLTEKLAEAQKELEASEEKLVNYAKKEGIVILGANRSSAAEDILSTLNRALTDAKEARITAEAAYRRSQNVAGADRTLENPAVQALKEELARAQAEYRDKSRLFKPGFPEMQQLQGRISELRSEIQREAASIDSATRGSLKAAYEAASQKESELKAEVKKQEAALMGERDRSVDYNTLQRKVEAASRNYDALETRLNEVRLAEDSGSGNVAIVDKAVVPSKPYKPNIPLNLGMGAVIGLLLGLLATILADLLDDRVKGVEDLKRALGSVPLLGVIPYTTGRNNKNVLALRGNVSSSSFMLEAFRSLRENILMMKAPSHHGLALVVNVTSPAPGEGKTTTAANLATVFAYTGKKVLLVDCDMRHPQAHNKVGVENTVGVSDFLLADKDIGEFLQTTPVQNLSIMTAGAAIPNPTELLAGERFPALLSEAEGMFDYVIVDGPPVMGLADALIISNRTGNTVFVNSYGQTRKRGLKDAFGRLKQAQCNVIGSVLTKMKSAEVSNKYYGYPSRYSRSSQTAMVATPSQ